MTSYSLFELNEYIKQVMALNFTEPIWVNCEVSQAREVRGQVYMEVVQHSESTDQIEAQSAVVIWYKSYLFIKTKLGELLPSLLTPGTKVMLKVNVEFHERYGLKLSVVDIDASFTIGQMEMARQKIIEKLKTAGITDQNSLTTLSPVIQRVAVISSATAAGYADFLAQINANEYGYAIQITLVPAAMQGMNTEREVCAALDTIAEDIDAYDCVAIIRGGGSKLDLASFDNYNIGHKIATYPIPVLTGIGHEIDNTVADLVSYLSIKTPTAVAAYIIDRNLQYESEILQMMQWIAQVAKQKIEYHKLELEQISQLTKMKPVDAVKTAHLQIQQLQVQLHQAAKYRLKEIADRIQYAESIIAVSDPARILKRGFTMVRNNGKLASSISDLELSEKVEIVYYDGTAGATIDNIINNKK